MRSGLITILLISGCVTDSATDSATDGETGIAIGELSGRLGVDYSWGRPSPQGLFNAGYTFASRYVSFDTTGKNLTASEANALRAAGLDIVVNWESSARDALGGFSDGVRNAQEAERLALAAGMPSSRPIYFSVDFDASESQQPTISAYFDGIASVIGRARVGAYGGYWPIKRLFDAGKIEWGWQTYAWSGGLWDARAQLRQIQNGVTIAGGSCDIDQALAADFGQWGHAISQGSTPGDVDGDGRADLVTAHSNGNVYAYAGAASGAFGSVGVSFAGTLDSALVDGTGHRLVGVADVTGDGLSDLVSVASSGTAYVWPGRAGRTFGNAVASFNGTMALATATSGGHDPVAVADVDGDGMADLITVHSNGNVYVYHGTASGNFGGGVANFSGTFQSALRTGVGHWVVGAADVNGDGRADLVTVHSNGNAYVYLGQADGSFAGTVSSFAGTMHAAVLDGQSGHVPVGVADVNGDGRADLVTVHSNGNAYVYLGHADGSFSGGASSFAGTLAMGQFGGTGHQVIGALDVTGDGRADLVTQRAGTVYVYPGTATGAFGGSTASFAGTLDSSFTDTTGHELVQMGTFARRRACPTTGCRAR